MGSAVIVQEVVRNKGRAWEVTLRVGEVIIVFRLNGNTPTEVSRMTYSTTLEGKRPWIPKKMYGQVIQKAAAILRNN